MTTPAMGRATRSAAILSLYNLSIVEKKALLLDLYQELAIYRKLSDDEIRLYYVFLEEFLTKRTEQTAFSFAAYHSIMDLLRQRISDKHDSLGRKGWLTTRNADMAHSFNSLVKKKVITKGATAKAKELFPHLYTDLPTRLRRRTHTKKCYQPIVEEILDFDFEHDEEKLKQLRANIQVIMSGKGSQKEKDHLLAQLLRTSGRKPEGNRKVMFVLHTSIDASGRYKALFLAEVRDLLHDLLFGQRSSHHTPALLSEDLTNPAIEKELQESNDPEFVKTYKHLKKKDDEEIADEWLDALNRLGLYSRSTIQFILESKTKTRKVTK